MKKAVTFFLRFLVILWFLCVIYEIGALIVAVLNITHSNWLYSSSMLVGIALIVITIYYDNLLYKCERKYGTLTYRVKKHLYKLTPMPMATLMYVVGGLVVLLMLQSGFLCSNRANALEREVSLYRNYYNATESLLDTLGIDGDSPILEGDAGAYYLDHKYQLDEYENNK